LLRISALIVTKSGALEKTSHLFSYHSLDLSVFMAILIPSSGKDRKLECKMHGYLKNTENFRLSFHVVHPGRQEIEGEICQI